jgi:hypothetical protein
MRDRARDTLRDVLTSDDDNAEKSSSGRGLELRRVTTPLTPTPPSPPARAHADMSATAGPRVALLPHRARARARATRASASSNPPAASSAATSTSNAMLPSPPTPTQLYAADARQTRYGANVARYLLDLHDHPPGATFNFCGGMMFGLVLSDALRSHLATVAANGECDPAQPVVQARSPSHRFPYDRVRVVNADP